VTAAGNGGNDGWVTWGAYQESTAAWTAACLTEAYVIITSEEEAAKVNMAGLTADIEALGGTGGTPAPAPAPAPAPQPGHAGLLAELAGLIREVEVSAGKDFSALTGWLASHGL
jgi:hypothetical protein